MTGVFDLRFPYTSPPLSLNARLHWARKANITAAIRDTTIILGRQAKLPVMDRCRVELTWYVTTGVARDVDNVIGTYKPMCDALVSLGIVPDDTPRWMEKVMPSIVQIPKASGPAHMILRVTRLEPGEGVIA